MAVTEMKRGKEVIIHRVRNGDGIFISPMWAPQWLTEKIMTFIFMPVNTVLRRWENFVLSAF